MNFFNSPMFQDRFRSLMKFAVRYNRWLIAGLVLSAITFTSCVTVNHVVMMPPHIKGAEFIGVSGCSECHSEIVDRFKWATHSRLLASGDNALDLGCEACHGAGSIHSESGGLPHTIVNPKKSPETCFQCHLDTRGSFNLPHGHSVTDGRMSCTDCHNPHEGDAVNGGGMNIQTAKETCTKCHMAQSDHYVFRHEALQDGCTVCHSPHGSVNDKMLKSPNATLCLQCHFQQQVASGEILIGGRDHASFLPRGRCWSAGCHEAIHGSNVSSSLRY